MRQLLETFSVTTELEEGSHLTFGYRNKWANTPTLFVLNSENLIY